MKYFAIDFETASREPASACSLGIVSGGVEAGSKQEWYELIRPPQMKFDDNCIRVNQIRPEDVQDKPEFPDFGRKFINYWKGKLYLHIMHLLIWEF